MKSEWIEKFERSKRLREGEYIETLTAFNSNIDTIYSFDNLDLDFTSTEPEMKDKVETLEDLKQVLLHCRENGVNKEVDGSDLSVDINRGINHIGGQAGIMANFLSNLNNSVTFYTPMLSERLSNLLNKDILYPQIEENNFVLKNVKDCVNTDRTKNNLIFEFSNGKTGRLIVSDNLKGFGPYFRKGIEQNLETMDENLDRVLVSGFHNAKGNKDAKLTKSEKQLSLLDTPKHLEYVTTDEDTREKLEEHILPEVDSIGLDEYEIKELSSKEIDEDDLNLGTAYKASKNLIEQHSLSRVHLHTYNFHLIVVEKDYPVKSEKIRDAMLFGELSSIQLAEKGRIPDKEDIEDFDMEGKYLKRLDDFEDFADYFELNNFVEKGIAELEGYRVVAIPTIVIEDPERLVGMGDVISSATFTSEIK